MINFIASSITETKREVEREREREVAWNGNFALI